MSIFVILTSILSSKSIKSSYEQYLNKSYVVMNSLNNEVIEGKNIHLVRSVASVSKIMTAIVAIENGNLEKEVIITKEDIDTYGSSIYLEVGDKVRLLDLVYGLMLRSGNDASKAIARNVGGTQEKFIDMMNEKAINIGMKNSTFTNPSGLDVNETGNLSTSYDLALLMSYAIKNDEFLKISGTKEYKSYKGIWNNKNKLLRNYKNTIAGKTGFTYKAKRTLVTAAKEDETTLVIVTLDCGNDFNFHKFLYERNFDKYISKQIFNKGENYIEDYILTCNRDIYLILEKERMNSYKLIHKIDGDYATSYLVNDNNEKEIGRCKVSQVKKNVDLSLFKKIKRWFIRK